MNAFKKILSSLAPKEKAALFVAAGIAAAAAAALIIFFVANATKTVPADGGSFTEGIVGQPTILNPLTAPETDDASHALVRLLFSPLRDLSAKMDRVDDAGRTWVVRLKEGLTWHDGRKITTDDIIFTLSRIQDPGTVSPLAGKFSGVRATRISELEVQFSVSSNAGFFADALARFPVIPKHIYADVPSYIGKFSYYRLKPVGSGPFRFASFDKRSDGFISSYTLRAFPAYALGKPHIDTFVINFYTKTDDLARAFNAGRADAWMVADPDALKKIRRTFDSADFSFPGFYALFLNQGRNEALKDTAVRSAISHAVDRDKMISDIFGGRAVRQDGPIPAGVQDGQGKAAGSGYSPDDARRILDEAGWTVGQDGVRHKTTKKNTADLTLSITVPTIPFLMKTGEMIKSDLAAVGIATTLVPLPIEEVRETAIRNRDYDALLFGNILSPSEDLYAFWHSSQRFSPGQNLSLYENKSADACLEGARTAVAEAERSRLVRSCATIISADYPAVFLYSPLYSYVFTNHAGGIEGGFAAEASDRFAGVVQWFVRETRVFK